MNNRGSISLPYRKVLVFPAWLFYVLAIGFFAMAWATLRGLVGLGFAPTLLVLIVPFSLLIWRWERSSL